MIDPETVLDDSERAKLITLTNMEGFKVLCDLMKIECQKFGVKLLNSDPAKKEEVLANHVMAKAATQFYVGVIDRINFETEMYYGTERVGDKPIDITEGLIDLGESSGRED